MPVPGYLETLERFGLEKLKRGGDLQIKNGDIAVTPDGDFQLGDTKFNALFRLVERWRLNQPTIDALFSSMLSTAQRLEEMMEDRRTGAGASLSRNPSVFHEETESIGDYESGSSVFAGTIFLVLNNLLQRFKSDLNYSDKSRQSVGPEISGYPVDAVFSAAANNFRHHDEWARTPQPTEQQRRSMEVLCAILDRPVMLNGNRAIRTNVCREVLAKISDKSIDRIYELIFEYAKSCCNSVK